MSPVLLLFLSRIFLLLLPPFFLLSPPFLLSFLRFLLLSSPSLLSFLWLLLLFFSLLLFLPWLLLSPSVLRSPACFSGCSFVSFYSFFAVFCHFLFPCWSSPPVSSFVASHLQSTVASCSFILSSLPVFSF